jgi:hypothetical protein
MTSFTYIGTTQMVYLLKGFPGGTFEGAGGIDIGSMPSTMAAVDLNHDGIPDLVVRTNSGTFTYLSQSDGTYSSTSDSVILGEQIFLADLDGDGNTDALYVPSSPYSTTSFRHGNGDGTFSDAVAGISLYHGASGATLADLNGDGLPDLVGIMDGSLYVWLGQGSGNFGTGVSYYSPPSGYAGRTIVADVNNDGIQDVVTMATPNVTVFFGAGDGQGTLKPPQGSYPGNDFALADVNGDGNLDLLTISPDANNVGVDIYLGDGTGSFGAPTFVSTSQAYTSITTGDLNLDGNPDLILLGNSAVGVLYGNGKGGFGTEHVFPVVDGPQNPIVADWNHDGAPDIAVANSIGGSPAPQAISFLLNRTGDTASLSLSANSSPYGQPPSLNASIVPTLPGSATPGGSVTLLVAATQLQGNLTNGSYSAQLPNLSVGSYAVSGSYNGDGNYLPKAFPTSTLTVTKANTTTSVFSSASPAIFGTTINFKVTVSPAFLGMPTGSVMLLDGANSLGTTTLDNTGTANFQSTSLSQGSHILSAQYLGDGNFVASSSAALTELVLYPTTISLASNASSILIGSTMTLTANVGSPYGTPTGNVTFVDGGTTLGQAAVTGGTATFSSSTLSQGIHSIQASYQGDSTFVMGASPVFSQAISDFSVSAANKSLTLSAGASGTYILNVSPLSGFADTVGFTCAGAPELATCTVSPTSVQVGSGSVSATVTVTTTGPNQAALHRNRHVRSFVIFDATAASIFLGFVGLLGRGNKRKHWPALALFGLLLIGGMSACGGGSGSITQTTAPKTPSGTSIITITATTAANGVTVDHTLALTLTVK